MEKSEIYGELITITSQPLQLGTSFMVHSHGLIL